MAVFFGFAPNWYEGQQNAGLGVYIATGSINGVMGFGNKVVTLPRNSTTYIYVTSGGVIGTGPSVPGGSYGIALVVSGQVNVGGNVNTLGPLGQWAGLSTTDGILSIQDIRT